MAVVGSRVNFRNGHSMRGEGAVPPSLLVSSCVMVPNKRKSGKGSLSPASFVRLVPYRAWAKARGGEEIFIFVIVLRRRRRRRGSQPGPSKKKSESAGVGAEGKKRNPGGGLTRSH